jgi:SAM-dependent methyltransferase
MPTPEQLGSFYPDGYYSHQLMPAASNSWKARIKKRLLPLATKEPEFEVPGRMLDIGCGSGWILERYRDLGWEVEGVEYSSEACQAGTDRGLTMHCGSLEDAHLPTARFDYIRSNHSFEHLVNPIATLDEINRLLKPSGTLFIGVPDTMGLMSRWFGSNWFYVGAPIHTINYNRRNLAALIDRSGFQVVSVRGNSNHGGTIGSVQSWIGTKLKRDVDLNGGPVTWAPLILIGCWASKLLDVFHQGDCVEVIATKRVATTT